MSLAFHILVLTFLGLLTIATLPDDRPILEVSILDVEHPVLEEIAEVDIELADFDQPLLDDAPFEAEAVAPEELTPGEIDIGPLESVGDLALTPVDDPRSPTPGRGGISTASLRGANGGKDGVGKGGTTTFFGTKARGNRIVFLVDNSNSMSDGRFETALLELGRSVELMSPKQHFYVILYSDAVYRMFHPDPATELVPATRPNKHKLYEWLRAAQMCLGGQLADAMRVAEELQPEIVFLLSDGVIGDYPLKCLTEPKDRAIVVHTIGMTVPHADAARKLEAIATANQGTFRAVGINLLARQMARQRPIKRNRTRGPVWGIRLSGD